MTSEKSEVESILSENLHTKATLEQELAAAKDDLTKME